jgi:YHS domain-containing protein
LPNLRCRRRGRFSVLEPCLGEYSCDPGGYKGIIVHPCIQIINFSEHQNDKVALFSANVDKTLLDMDHRTEGNFLLVPSSNAWKEQLAFPETVCHRTIRGDPAYYPQADFHGRKIYFCTGACQSVFLSDPERFYAAHSKSRP